VLGRRGRSVPGGQKECGRERERKRECTKLRASLVEIAGGAGRAIVRERLKFRNREASSSAGSWGGFI